MMEWPGLGTAFWLQLTRDLRLAFRHIGQAANPLMFFVMVTTLFPLALSPAPELLQAIAPGVIWVSALLASLLAAESLAELVEETAQIAMLVQLGGQGTA